MPGQRTVCNGKSGISIDLPSVCGRERAARPGRCLPSLARSAVAVRDADGPVVGRRTGLAARGSETGRT